MELTIVLQTGLRAIIDSEFNAYINEAFNHTGPILNIAKNFAKIGIAVFALFHFAGPDRANVLKGLKWFPLLFILLNYGVFTRAVFDFYQSVGESFQDSTNNWDTLQARVLANQVNAVKSIKFATAPFYFDLASLNLLIQAGLASTLTNIGFIVSTLFFIGVKAMSIMYLFVLIVFGPLNIGLSFIPALSGMWKTWLQKFMNVALWVPMLYVIDAFMLSLLDKLVTNLSVNNSTDFSTVIMAGFLMIMSCFFYIKAPSLSNFVVQGLNVGGGGMVSKPKNMGKKAIKTAIDAKTGGVTKAARTLVQ